MIDSDEQKRSAQALAESEERLRLIVENARDYAIFTMDLAARITDWREGAEAVFGFTRDEILGRDADILYTPEDNANHEPEKERALAASAGKAPNVRWHVCKDGDRVFIEGVCTALHDANGRLTGFLKVGKDATERHVAEERQKLLLAELQHRVRNILSMVRSVVRQSGEGQPHVEDYVNHLIGRLDAMARTQVVLTRAPGASVDLEELVRDELVACAIGERRVTVAGPSVALSPKAAEVITLALHELATNSIKYGVLSKGEGGLSIKWSQERRGEQAWVLFAWEETGRGPAPRLVQRGFGTELIERRVPYELRGEANLVITANGMKSEIMFPLTDGSSILETRPARGRPQ